MGRTDRIGRHGGCLCRRCGHDLSGLQTSPLHRQPGDRRCGFRHRRHRSHFLLLRRQGEDRHRPPPWSRSGDRPGGRRAGRSCHDLGIRLADAVARRRRPPDRRQQGRRPQDLCRASEPVQQGAGRADRGWRLDGDCTGRKAPYRRRYARRADAGRLRLRRHRHVRLAMEGPRGRCGGGGRSHYRRCLGASGRKGHRLAGYGHQHSRPSLDAGPLFPRRRTRSWLGRHQYRGPAEHSRPLEGKERRPARSVRPHGLHHR